MLGSGFVRVFALAVIPNGSSRCNRAVCRAWCGGLAFRPVALLPGCPECPFALPSLMAKSLGQPMLLLLLAAVVGWSWEGRWIVACDPLKFVCCARVGCWKSKRCVLV